MNNKVLLELNNVIFTQKYIIVKKRRGEIYIDYDNIKEASYSRKSFWNFILPKGISSPPPGLLLIRFKEKIGRQHAIVFEIEHDELLKLPKKILNKLLLPEYYTPFA